jgi:hypothetical protein
MGPVYKHSAAWAICLATTLYETGLRRGLWGLDTSLMTPTPVVQRGYQYVVGKEGGGQFRQDSEKRRRSSSQSNGALRVRSSGQADCKVVILAHGRATNSREGRGGRLVAWMVLVRCAWHGVVVYYRAPSSHAIQSHVGCGPGPLWVALLGFHSRYQSERGSERGGKAGKVGEGWVIGSRLGGRRLVRNVLSSTVVRPRGAVGFWLCGRSEFSMAKACSDHQFFFLVNCFAGGPSRTAAHRMDTSIIEKAVE